MLSIFNFIFYRSSFNLYFNCRPVTGRFVSFYKNEALTLVMCEFEVYGDSVHKQDGNIYIG